MMSITFKDILWVLISGVLVTLPFLNFSLSPLAWIALVPLIIRLSGKKVGSGAVLGLGAGLVFWLGGIYWLWTVTWPGYLILCLYLSLYGAAWGAGVSFISWRRPAWLWWAAPAGWVTLEYLRTYLFTGFPWNLLGVSQTRNLPLIQIASITGVYGVSFLVIMTNAAVANLLINWNRWRRTKRSRIRLWLPLAAAGLLLFGSFQYGSSELDKAGKGRASPASLAVSLVQGGISQELKWVPSLAAQHLQTYLGLSHSALGSRPDLVIWPESSIPYYPEEREDVRTLLIQLARKNRIYLLIGADYRTATSPIRYFNSAYLWGPDGTRRGRYDKIHLVPYGEYTPLKRFLPFLRQVVPWEDDFSVGENLVLFDLNGVRSPPPLAIKLGVLICYEDIFPGLVRNLIGRGANVMVNLTNDAWYGRTIAPFQHAYNALFRSVENRVYLCRATNTGYSCIIDPWGRIIAEVTDERGESLFVAGWCEGEVGPVKSRSFYTTFGDVFSLSCIILVTIAFIGCCRRKMSSTIRE